MSVNKFHTTTIISIRNEEGNSFIKESLRIEVTGHNGISIIGTLNILPVPNPKGEYDKPYPSLSFALNESKVLFITGVGSNGMSFDYIKLIGKTQPELTNNILLLYKNFEKNLNKK